MTIGARFAFLLLFLACSLLPASPLPAQSGEAYAVIAGTVFRDPGFSLANAQVTLTAVSPPPGGKRFKALKGRSDARGEFAFRVPAGSARYKVSVSAPGLAGEEKEVQVTQDERVDVYFSLKPASK